ncbi:DUF397 domain-containing protein [Streptomyces sp. GXMU-J15]|uniref:DUF397 domain-containing protein n=1 Tax=Streptomyces fuscus TaxID=3048495 RepID=A0ABT7JBK0_9ACTN|nr:MULTISPECIES: DUF397 domain-containing protein [Streptomyces]MDL2081761.1 DUF397 domain-containing protein [Streptomyces fuscus]SBT89827.1 protein of unknown function [Streptomyces sp. DI166]
MTAIVLTWVKSSYSGADEADCVEVAISPTTPTIRIRDSKNQTGPHVTVSHTAWSAFLNSRPV